MSQTSQTELNSAVAKPAIALPTSSELSALTRLENLLERFIGRRPPPTPDSAWAAFRSLPEAHRQHTVAGWQAQSRFIEAALNDGITAADEITLLRYAMTYLGLLTDSGLYEMIDKDDLVEVLDENHLQLHRSYNFFNLCNYSLVELSSYPFFELYESSSKILGMLIERGGYIFRGEQNYVSLADLPEYTLRELRTQMGTVFEMRERFLLATRSTITGTRYVISVKKVREIAQAPSRSSIRFI